MSTKVEQVSGVEQTIQTAVRATTSASSTTISPKVSMFAKKSGFVIPKNKLSGSLVPVFRGTKKPGATDVEGEEHTKQVLRKTKWGPDLTQDASVRKGRALAYQIRVDQITEQLKSGILEAGDDQDSQSDHSAAQKSPAHQLIEKSKLLELERREVIGEILKLNPSYKAPADYKPLLKEAKVPIPIKEFPGHNFIGLIFGPANDTQKRLEKETGAKIRVYGTKADTKKESEITSSDGNEAHGGYEEFYVLVTADTYEKVDTAVSLIELLVTPFSANNVADSTTSVAVSKDNQNVVSQSQDRPPAYSVSPVVVNQGAPRQAPPLTQFQPYPNQWLPPNRPSGFIAPPFPNPSSPITALNSTIMSLLFGQRPVMSGGFSVPHTPAIVPPQRSHILQAPNMPGPPRNISLPTLQITPGQPNFSAPSPFNPPTSNQNLRPMGSLMPQSTPQYTNQPVTSTSWSQPRAGLPSPGQTHRPNPMQPTIRPQPPLPMASQSGSQPTQSGSQQPPFSQFPSSVISTSIPPPAIKPPSITALKPLQPNDFTFRPHRPQTPSSQPIPRPGIQPRPQLMPHHNPSIPFRPGMSNNVSPSPPVMQNFSRPQNNQQMGQINMPAPQPRPAFTGPGITPRPSPQMGPRQFGPSPPRPGNFGQPSMGFRPQNFSTPTNQQFRGNVPFSSGRPYGPQQVYDPFSPTAGPLKSQLGGNPQNSRKQESDPEYDDLMASVGVK